MSVFRYNLIQARIFPVILCVALQQYSVRGVYIRLWSVFPTNFPSLAALIH